jgi:UDP-N-acetylglucosamine 3-dehydrogenase
MRPWEAPVASASEQTLRAGVIGLGAMGMNHARVYAEIEGVELAAVADPASERRRLAARPTLAGSVRAYPDYREMLAAEQLDLLSVAVPTGLHREVALAALERRVATLVEKPIAADLEDGRAIVRAAQATGCQLMVGHVERFNPAVQELKRRLDAGHLGRVFLARAERVGPFPQRTRDVGVVLDLATHDIDILRFLLGCEVERVYAETATGLRTEHEDLLSAVMRFRGGVVGLLEVNWLTPAKVRRLALVGEKGMFVVDYLTQELLFYERQSVGAAWPSLAALTGGGEGVMTRIPVQKQEPLRAELEAFVESVARGSPAPIPAEDALAAVEVAACLAESGRTGQVVPMKAQVTGRGEG